MPFLKRENKLETPQRQVAIIDRQIGELQGQIENLTDSSKMDPVLKLWLETRYGFDYTQEKAIYEKILREKQALICELEKERDKLQPQINEAQFQQELQQKEIRFEGVDVDGYVGSIVKIHCSHCGHCFETDLRNHGSFNNVILCSNQTALNQVYAMKANRAWPLQCQKCHVEVDVWIFRGKI